MFFGKTRGADSDLTKPLLDLERSEVFKEVHKIERQIDAFAVKEGWLPDLIFPRGTTIGKQLSLLGKYADALPGITVLEKTDPELQAVLRPISFDSLLTEEDLDALRIKLELLASPDSVHLSKKHLNTSHSLLAINPSLCGEDQTQVRTFILRESKETTHSETAYLLGKGGEGIVKRLKDRVIVWNPKTKELRIKNLEQPLCVKRAKETVCTEEGVDAEVKFDQSNDEAFLSLDKTKREAIFNYKVTGARCSIGSRWSAEGRLITYLVMPEIPGQTLWKYIYENKERITPKTFFMIAQEAALKIQAMNDKGVLHRDIKLTNVMFDSDSKDLNIVDFGDLSMAATEAPSHLTKSSMDYLAPEIFYPEEEPCDDMTKVDVYGLAYMLFDMAMMIEGSMSGFLEQAYRHRMIDDHRRVTSVDEQRKYVASVRAKVPHLKLWQSIENEVLRDELIRLLQNMLSYEPAARPSMDKVVLVLSSIPFEELIESPIRELGGCSASPRPGC